MIVNRNEISDILDVSLPTIDSWISKGMPIEKAGAKGTPAQFDAASCFLWFKENILAKPEQHTDVLKLRKLKAEAELATIMANKARVSVVDVKEAKAVFEQLHDMLSRHVLKLPDRVPSHRSEILAECESILAESYKQLMSCFIPQESEIN